MAGDKTVPPTETTAQQEVSSFGAITRLPTFYKVNPTLWFLQIEAVFATSRVTSPQIKFQIVVAALDMEVLTQVADILTAECSDPYTALKQRLVSIYGESESRRIQKLLADTQLGSQRPSQLYRQMLQLAGNTVTNDVVRTLWLRNLPPRVQEILAATKQADVEALTAVADKIMEVYRPNEIYANSEQPSASSSNDALLNELRKLREGVAELRIQNRQSRFRNRSTDRFQDRGRNKSRERLNVLYERNWTRLVHAELQQLETQVARAVRAGAAEQEVHWSFSGSLLYSLTVITTIGCGNLGPKTTEGKLATMVYALVGVPLMLVCFSHLGSVLAHLIQTAYAALCGCSIAGKANERLELEERRVRGMEVVGGGCGRAVCRLTSLESVLDYSRHDSEDEDSPIRRCRGGGANETPSRMPLIWRGQQGGGLTPPPPPEFRSPPGPLVPPALALSLLAGYLGLGAWYFSAAQERAYLDGLYFAFTALSTIGLTDPKPGKRPELHLLAVCLYILVGLVVVATAFALVQEQVVSKTRQLAVSLGVVKKEELPV